MTPLFKRADPEPEYEYDASFGDECKEAFLRLVQERDAIDLNQPAHRRENGKKWLAKHTAINDVLDQYLVWRDIEAL